MYKISNNSGTKKCILTKYNKSNNFLNVGAAKQFAKNLLGCELKLYYNPN